MKINRWHFVYLFILVVLAVCIGMLCQTCENSKVDNAYRTTTDTIKVTDTVYECRIDTVHYGFPVLVDDEVVDTLYLTKTEILKDTDSVFVKLPISQKHYAQDSVYDAWVSGYEPSLDSISVYPKTEYITITNETKIETVKEIFPECVEWYIFGGLNVADGTLNPKIGVSIKTKKDWLISPEIGWYKNSPTYGITIGKKIK